MAERIVLMTRGDQRQAWAIIDAFAERTGLEARKSDRVAEFPLGPDDHHIQVVQTLTDIDPRWSDHVALGPPEAS
jgi:hypothetical protein